MQLERRFVMKENSLKNPEAELMEPRLPRNAELLFQCPRCGGDEIIQVMVNFKKIRVYSSCAWIWEPVSDRLDSQELRFQCGQCEYILKKDSGKEVKTISDLVICLINSTVVL